jgi:hypothetical protein
LGTKKSVFDTFFEEILYIDSEEKREALNGSGK